MEACWQDQEAGWSHYIPAQEAESEQEVEVGCEASRHPPPSDSLFFLMKLYNLQIIAPAGNQVFTQEPDRDT